MACQFLLKWPTLQKLQKSREKTLRKFYYRYNSRSHNKIEERLALIKKAQPLTRDLVLLETLTLTTDMLCRQLLEIGKSIQKFKRASREVRDELEGGPDDDKDHTPKT